MVLAGGVSHGKDSMQTLQSFRAAAEVVSIGEYMIGPLPVSHLTKIRDFSFAYNSGKSHMVNHIPDFESFKDWPYSITKEISDITTSTLGAVINSDNRSDPNGLELSFRDPWLENGRTVRWSKFQRASPIYKAQTILP